MPTPSRVHCVLLLLIVTACGGSVTKPSPPLRLSVGVTPNPLAATSGGGQPVQFEATVTIRELTGSAVQIQRFTATIVSTQQSAPGQSSSSSVSELIAFDHRLPPLGTLTYAYSPSITTTASSGGSLRWRFEVSGVDDMGRPVAASSADIPLVISGS